MHSSTEQDMRSQCIILRSKILLLLRYYLMPAIKTRSPPTCSRIF